MVMRTRNAEIVKWDRPKTIHGILDAIDAGTNDRGEYRIYRARDRETERRLVFFGARQLDELLGPGDVGHFFTLEYRGKITTKRGNSVHAFEVAVDDAPSALAPNQTDLFDDDKGTSESSDVPF